MVYIVEGPKNTHKRHQIQLQKCRLNDYNRRRANRHHMFDLDPEIRQSGRKRKFTDPLMIDPKRKKYWQYFYEVKGLGEGCCGNLAHLTIMDSSHRYSYWEISLPESQITIELTPLQVSGSISAVLSAARIWPMCVSVPGDFLRPQGAFPPGFYLLREGWVHRPAPEAPLIRGMPTGP